MRFLFRGGTGITKDDEQKINRIKGKIRGHIHWRNTRTASSPRPSAKERNTADGIRDICLLSVMGGESVMTSLNRSDVERVLEKTRSSSTSSCRRGSA